jgi:hypothetical protein
MRFIDSTVVADWLKGGANLGTVPALRAMFNDAHRPQAGALINSNPFAQLGLKRSKGRKYVQPPTEAEVERMIAVADKVTPPSFAAYLLTAVWSAARPGELDALRWSDLDFTPEGECIHIEQQWNVKVRKFTPPKHGSRREVAMVARVGDRLLDLPRESEFVFTTIRGHDYTPSTRPPSLEPRPMHDRDPRRRPLHRHAPLVRVVFIERARAPVARDRPAARARGRRPAGRAAVRASRRGARPESECARRSMRRPRLRR